MSKTKEYINEKLLEKIDKLEEEKILLLEKNKKLEERLEETKTTFHLWGGTVGFGTTSPRAKLHISSAGNYYTEV